MSQEAYTQGEFYDLVEIVTLDEAIKDYLWTDEIRDAVERKIETEEEDRERQGKEPVLTTAEEQEIWDETEKWYREHISSVEGFYLRKDGKVEIDRSY